MDECHPIMQMCSCLYFFLSLTAVTHIVFYSRGPGSHQNTVASAKNTASTWFQPLCIAFSLPWKLCQLRLDWHHGKLMPKFHHGYSAGRLTLLQKRAKELQHPLVAFTTSNCAVMKVSVVLQDIAWANLCTFLNRQLLQFFKFLSVPLNVAVTQLSLMLWHKHNSQTTPMRISHLEKNNRKLQKECFNPKVFSKKWDQTLSAPGQTFASLSQVNK